MEDVTPLPTSDNILRHELIGLDVEVVESPDETLVGTHGRLIYETHRSLEIKSDGETKTVPKKGHGFVFDLGSERERVRVEGDAIHESPADRTKTTR
ncbi:MAG: ribonuclease P protein subunit [Halobacteria archaeon]|nr:ribonuclease P protein subunit [Halobacteria archaeon]